MDSWSPPEKVEAESIKTFYYEWKQSPFMNPSDDSAGATYQLEGTNYYFHVKAQASGGYTRYYFDTYVDLLNSFRLSDYNDSRVKTGWNHDGTVEFSIYEKNGVFYLHNPIKADLYFTDSLSWLGNRKFKNICMLGSHDAGMYKLTGGTAFAKPGNAQTQSKSIKEQLVLGARYFDIRPVIGNGGEYLAGHYSGEIDILTWHGRLGANGAPLSDIVSDINAFHSNTHKNELVIVDLSHGYNADRNYGALNSSEWSNVFRIFGNLSGLIKPSQISGNLLEMSLNDILAKGNVILRLDDNVDSNVIPDFVFKPDKFPIYNNYANKNDISKMASDQINKMKGADHNKNLFVLSWTLTQQDTDLVFKDIRSDAKEANRDLARRLLPAVTPAHYPNIIFIDNIASSIPTGVAREVNKKRILREPYWDR